MPNTPTPLPVRGGRRGFSTLLPSAPIPLPFQGDYGLLSVQYDLDRVMSLRQRLPDLASAVLEELDAARRAGQEIMSAWNASPWGSWDAPPAPDKLSEWQSARAEHQAEYEAARQAYADALDGCTALIDAAGRKKDLLVISDTVVRLGVYARLSEKDERGRDVPLDVWEWPFSGAAPDPSEPGTWEAWSGPVLSWLASAGLEKARAQLQNPN